MAILLLQHYKNRPLMPSVWNSRVVCFWFVTIRVISQDGEPSSKISMLLTFTKSLNLSWRHFRNGLADYMDTGAIIYKAETAFMNPLNARWKQLSISHRLPQFWCYHWTKSMENFVHIKIWIFILLLLSPSWRVWRELWCCRWWSLF